ncbi:MAG: hypothetical protein QN178_07370 [Armatimonadota bacterium]|nr:hypothetical protein [Armatimonadota bacterium]
MRTIASWVAFGAAVASFSKLWVGVRSGLEGQRLYGALEAVWWMTLFLGSMAYLAFVIYAADRAAGRAKRALPLFDRMLDRPRPKARQAGAGRES